MLFARSSLLDGLEVVVLDEVHYLQDPYRGSVWEEVLVLTPPDVSFVSLSATVSNADRLRRLAHLGPGDHPGHRGDPSAGHPPPPLRPGRAGAGRPRRPARCCATGRPTPTGRRSTTGGGATPGSALPRAPRGARWSSTWPTSGMLPAIAFIFSRAACDDATRQCLQDGIRLTTPEERVRIRAADRGRGGAAERRRSAHPRLRARGRRRWRPASPLTTPAWSRPSARRSSSASPRGC